VPNVMTANGALCPIVGCVTTICEDSFETCEAGTMCGQNSNFNGCIPIGQLGMNPVLAAPYGSMDLCLIDCHINPSGQCEGLNGAQCLFENPDYNCYCMSR